MKKWVTRFLPLLLLMALLMTSCITAIPGNYDWQGKPEESWDIRNHTGKSTEDGTSPSPKNPNQTSEPSDTAAQFPTTSENTVQNPQPQEPEQFSVDLVPPYSGNPYVAIHNNIPYFTPDEITDRSFEYYSQLDKLGRCGVATACVGTDIMPTEPRKDISSVSPTGWKQATYDFISGKYLYNRCHLIGFQLTGENANKLNLITGTRYFNISGMIKFENQVAAYVKETENHVMYRVTPVFEGANLLASGVLIEGMSVEDNGEDILFCVWCYNVQPGVIINYADGSSKADTAAGNVSYTADVAVVMFGFLACTSESKQYF